jgi:hypothetical protein
MPRRGINRLRDLFGAIGDRLVVDGGDLLRRLGSALAAPFERAGWALRRRLIWPVADRVPRPAGTDSRLVLGVAVVLAACVGAAGLLLVASHGGSGGSAVTEAAAPAGSSSEAPPAAHRVPPEPTLQGAAPNFKEGSQSGRSAVGSAKELEPLPTPATPPATTSGSASSAATEKIASAPSAQASSVASPATGPSAIAVAHEFADAFVVYETGGKSAGVRDAFGKTATRQLTQALLRRPPRLPADVKVPRAKVVNVVAGPARGPMHSVSVSLLRVGVTSELRLALEKTKSEGWRVTDVLG